GPPAATTDTLPAFPAFARRSSRQGGPRAAVPRTFALLPSSPGRGTVHQCRWPAPGTFADIRKRQAVHRPEGVQGRVQPPDPTARAGKLHGLGSWLPLLQRRWSAGAPLATSTIPRIRPAVFAVSLSSGAGHGCSAYWPRIAGYSEPGRLRRCSIARNGAAPAP